MTKRFNYLSIMVTSLLVGTLCNNQTLKQDLVEIKEHKDQIQKEYFKLYGKYTYLSTLMGQQKNIETKEVVNEKPTFNIEDITQLSNATVDDFNVMLNGTPLSRFSSVFVDIEEIYNINGIVIASLVALESGWGGSNLAVNYNNYTGYAQYDVDPVSVSFTSAEDCVLKTAELLHTDYISPTGKYNTGANLYAINKVYSSDIEWASKIQDIANGLINNLTN